MHILILGARGMVGRELSPAFSGSKVTAWDRGDLDITEGESVNERIGTLEPDLVVNAAAYTDVDAAERNEDEATAVNGYAVGNLAVTCASLEIPLLHISTEMVYGQEREGGYAEADEPIQPKNAYGRSKLLGETLLKENGQAYWLVRSAWVFGTSGRDFFAKVQHAAEGNTSMPVVSDVMGSPTYARDLARALASLVRDRPPFGVYHLVNEGVATRAECAERFFQLLKRPIRVERVAGHAVPSGAPRQRISILRNTKRPPLRSWQDALAEYVREFPESPAR